MVQLLVFELAGRSFALPAGVLLEVARSVAVAPLPSAPPIIEGVINVHGALVPVLDIRQRFGVPPRPIALDQHLLITRSGARVVALRVDRAVDLIAVEEDTIEPVSRVAPGGEYMAGIARLPDGVLVIHDVERFLSLDEAQRVDAALLMEQAGDRPTGAPFDGLEGSR